MLLMLSHDWAMLVMVDAAVAAPWPLLMHARALLSDTGVTVPIDTSQRMSTADTTRVSDVAADGFRVNLCSRQFSIRV